MYFDVSLTCFHRIVENGDNTMNQFIETSELIVSEDAAKSKQMPGSYISLYIYCSFLLCVFI